MTDMMWPLRVAMMELDLIGGDEVFRKEALRCVRDIAQDMMDDLPDITLRQAQDAYNRFAARLRKRLGIKDTSTMKEMDQDGCLVDQEADTHEASQPRLLLLRNYPGNSVRLYMRDENGNVTEIAGREEYGLNLEAVGMDVDGTIKPLDELSYTRKESQPITGEELLAVDPELFRKVYGFLPAPEADTPVVTEAKE